MCFCVSAIVNSWTWLFWAVQSDQTSDFTRLETNSGPTTKQRGVAVMLLFCFKSELWLFLRKQKHQNHLKFLWSASSWNHRREVPFFLSWGIWMKSFFPKIKIKRDGRRTLKLHQLRVYCENLISWMDSSDSTTSMLLQTHMLLLFFRWLHIIVPRSD